MAPVSGGPIGSGSGIPAGSSAIPETGTPGALVGYDDAGELVESAVLNPTVKTLTLAGANGVQYGAEILTNPDFNNGTTGWTCNSGAEVVDGMLHMFDGVLSTCAISSGGSSYQQGDVLHILRTDSSDSGATVTVTTVSSGVVTGISITTTGKQLTVGVKNTSGGSGTGCTINVTATTVGKAIQVFTSEVNSWYKLDFVIESPLPTPSLGSSVSMIFTNFAWEGLPFYSATNASGDQDWWTATAMATTTSMTVAVWFASGYTALTTTVRLSLVSVKKVLEYAVSEITSEEGGAALCESRRDAAGHRNFFRGVGAGKYAVSSRGCIAIGEDAMKNGRHNLQSVAIGERALRDLSGKVCCTAVGWEAAETANKDEVSAFGWRAARNVTGLYITAVGKSALDGTCSGNWVTAVGQGAGVTSSGTNCTYLGNMAGYVNSKSNFFALTCYPTTQEAQWLMTGVQDIAGTTGYMIFRAAVKPQATDAYDLGSSALRWKTAYTQSQVLGGLPISVDAAAPVAGTYVLGAIVINSAPSAGGTFAWQCVEAGTPGVWKAVALAA